MKTWKQPLAVGREFAANDYVSACQYLIKCDIGNLPNGASEIYVPNGSTTDFKGTGDPHDSWGIYGSPCGKVHNVSRDTQFYVSEFKYGWNDELEKDVTFDSTVQVAWWRELDESGNVKNIHWTSPENIANPESNKS